MQTFYKVSAVTLLAVLLMGSLQLTILHDEKQRVTSVDINKKIRADIMYDPTGQKYVITGDLNRYMDLLYSAVTMVKDRRLESIGKIDSLGGIDGPVEVVNVGTGRKVLLHDDMETLLKWYQGSGTVATDNTFAFSGSQSLQITCGAADATGNAIRTFGMPQSKLLSLECKFAVDDYATNLLYLGFRLVNDDGINRRVASILLQGGAANYWAYQNEAGVVTWIPGSRTEDFYEAAADPGIGWQYFRMVADFNTMRYVSFQANEVVYTLDEPFYNAATDNVKYTRVDLLVDGQIGLAVNGWFDDVTVMDEG